MRVIAFALSCLACTGHGRKVQSIVEPIAEESRYEIFVMDASATEKMTQKIGERAQHWASRGAEMKLCSGPIGVSNPLETFAKLLLTSNPGAAWQVTGARSLTIPMRSRRMGMSPQMSVGLYYSTSTGNTETVAGYIADGAGIEDWKDIGDAENDEILGHDAIIVGSPTWHTGADTERSGTSWDEWLYNQLPEMDFSGKKVAIFGVGDSASYGENYCDAMGELYDLFTAKGAKVYGMTSGDEGFDYSESKSLVDGKFVGKVFDEDNYSDESEERTAAWIEQLKSEGFM